MASPTTALSLLPTVQEPQLSTICPTGYHSFLPSPATSLQNIPYYTPVCVANPVCGYGQPYNETSQQCHVPGPAASGTLAGPSLATCPRGSAFDTYLGHCVYVGDLVTPTTISVSTLWCNPATSSLTMLPASTGLQTYTCKGPPTIAPASAVVVGNGNGGGGATLKSVQGIPAYPTPVAAAGATVVSVSTGASPADVTVTKIVGGSISPLSPLPYIFPIFGNITSGDPNPGSVIVTEPSVVPGTALLGGAGTLDCSMLSNLTTVADLASNNSTRLIECIEALQYGCPSASQITLWDTFYPGAATLPGASSTPAPVAPPPGNLTAAVASIVDDIKAAKDGVSQKVLG